MIERRPFNQLAAADHGWLKAKHHFSFGEFADPTRMGWGALRVWKGCCRHQDHGHRRFRAGPGRHPISFDSTDLISH
jgi:redox-sensitive bicupin YhaK (pirin superfamily)